MCLSKLRFEFVNRRLHLIKNMYLGYGSSENESSKWEKVINEVVDSNAFDPPCLQSSNVQSDRKICEISTIEHENAMPKYLPGLTLLMSC